MSRVPQRVPAGDSGVGCCCPFRREGPSWRWRLCGDRTGGRGWDLDSACVSQSFRQEARGAWTCGRLGARRRGCWRGPRGAGQCMDEHPSPRRASCRVQRVLSGCTRPAPRGPRLQVGSPPATRGPAQGRAPTICPTFPTGRRRFVSRGREGPGWSRALSRDRQNSRPARAHRGRCGEPPAAPSQDPWGGG